MKKLILMSLLLSLTLSAGDGERYKKAKLKCAKLIKDHSYDIEDDAELKELKKGLVKARTKLMIAAGKQDPQIARLSKELKDLWKARQKDMSDEKRKAASFAKLAATRIYLVDTCKTNKQLKEPYLAWAAASHKLNLKKATLLEKIDKKKARELKKLYQGLNNIVVR